MLELVSALPDSVEPIVACPPGPLADAAARLGVRVAGVPGTEGSLKLRPVQTARAVAEIASSARATRRAGRRVGADLVHANSVRSGLIAAIAGGAGAPPTVVHIRDCLPPGPATKVVSATIAARADAIIANSGYTARCFAGSRPDAPYVVFNPVDLDRFDPESISRDDARSRLHIRGDEVLLAVVAQITPWKGQDDAIRVLASLVQGGHRARLLLVGEPKFVSASTRYDNITYQAGLETLTQTLGVADRVDFLGERGDVAEILRALDLLLVPSWEEPFGRTVVEALAMGTPSIATRRGGPAEVIEDRWDGILLEPRRPDLWAQAAKGLLERPEILREMADRGPSKAARFSKYRHAREVMDIYEAASASRRRTGRPRA